ncbi:ubiquitin-like protein [Trichoderma reesei RUT C-30]|nr:ubiquitin-like protein [Trichoderma reesei RUT C-30]
MATNSCISAIPSLRSSDYRDRSRDRDRERANRDRGSYGDRERDNREKERDGDRPRDTRDTGRERDGDRYRDHGRRRDYRDRSPDRGGDRYERRQRSRSPRRHTSGFRFKGDEPRRRPRENAEKRELKESREAKDAKAPKAPKPSATAGQEMIIVHVNDRLGTKSAIPCLPSDTVGQFKLMIAARIGREAGQIMLRRQGERPFKDHITLEDYGISNGVQLDLEVDTGD